VAPLPPASKRRGRWLSAFPTTQGLKYGERRIMIAVLEQAGQRTGGERSAGIRGFDRTTADARMLRLGILPPI
jgi:hypothetical protein